MTISLSAEVELQVPFHDADPLGVVWHGNYFRYFEHARAALLDRIDYNYRQMEASGYAWPIVDTRVKFIRSLRFEQRFRVCATLEEYENRLRIGYEIRDVASGERLTTGYTIQVAIDMATGETCFVSPDVLYQKLGVNR